MIMRAARFLECCSALDRSSSMFTLPCASVDTCTAAAAAASTPCLLDSCLTGGRSTSFPAQSLAQSNASHTRVEYGSEGRAHQRWLATPEQQSRTPQSRGLPVRPMHMANLCAATRAAAAPWLTVTIFMPAMTADAGLVPCADTGMMHTLRCLSPRDLQGQIGV